MEGVTNFPMRLWFWLASAPETMATPFLRATATFPVKDIPENFAPELFRLREITPYDLIPQIMTAEADDFLRTAELFSVPYTHIELNAGCPSPNCVGKGAGSSLLADPTYFAAMIKQISDRLGSEKFAVKMRTGFHHHDEFPKLIEVLKDVAICRLTIHGRTRPQGYKGLANWDLIESAARQLPMPVFASGDIADAAGLQRSRQAFPHVAGTIIGRGALRNPWIFEEIRTSAALDLDRETTVFALASFGLMQDLYLTKFQTLADLAAAGVFQNPCFRNAAAWKDVYTELSKAAFGFVVAPENTDFDAQYILDRKSAGRMKLLWNYLRSSLPASFFVPQVMRSTSPGALIHAISGLFKDDAPVPLRYNPDLDWIFNGEKNERQAAVQRQAAALQKTQPDEIQLSLPAQVPALQVQPVHLTAAGSPVL